MPRTHNTTYTFKMPAQNVTVSAEFEQAKLAITTVVDPDENAGTITLETDPDSQPIPEEGVVMGTKIKVTAAVKDDSEDYILDEIKVTETESGAEVELDEGNVFTMPAKPVTVTAVYYKRVVNLDFQGDGAAAEFLTKSRCNPTVAADPVAENADNKVMQYTADGNAGNGVGVAQYDFSKQIGNARKAIIEFDSYMSGGRINFDVVDLTVRPAFSTATGSADYNKTGILWRQGAAKDITISGTKYEQYTIQDQNDTSNNMLEQADAETKKVYKNWVHTKLVIDYSTDKINYEITNKKSGESIKSGETSFDNGDANYATGLEVFNWVNNSKGYMDNIEVYAVQGEAQQVNITYVDAADKEGEQIKTAETATAVKGTKYNAPTTKTATFDVADARYSFNAGESTKTVTAGEEDVVLAFDKNEKKTAKITVKLDEAAEEDVTVPVVVTGSPTHKVAGEADVNQTVSITVPGGQTTATDNSLSLFDGTYTYSVDEYQVYGYGFDEGKETGTVTVGDDATTIELKKQTDPTFIAKVQTVPFATVKLEGTSTGETEYADGTALTATANATGIAELKGATEGTAFTLTITSGNKYLDNADKSQQNVTITKNSMTEPVDATVKYSDDNMIYGQDFSDAADGVSVRTKDAGLQGWTFTDGLAMVNIVQKTGYPRLVNTAAKDGNYLMLHSYSSGGTYELTTNDSIASLKFDAGYGTYYNEGTKSRTPGGESTTIIKLGDTEIAKYDPTANTLTVGEGSVANILTVNKWLNFDIKIAGTTATITVNDGSNNVIDAKTVTLKSADVKTLSFNTSANSKNQWACIAIDNLEIYKAAE